MSHQGGPGRVLNKQKKSMLQCLFFRQRTMYYISHTIIAMSIYLIIYAKKVLVRKFHIMKI